MGAGGGTGRRLGIAGSSAKFARRYPCPRPRTDCRFASPRWDGRSFGVFGPAKTPRCLGGKHERTLWSRSDRKLRRLQLLQIQFLLWVFPAHAGGAEPGQPQEHAPGRGDPLCRRPKPARHVHSMFGQSEPLHHLARRQDPDSQDRGSLAKLSASAPRFRA